MAFTQAQLDALEAAIAGGELTVEYQDKRVTYRSLREMMEIRTLMRQQLGVQSAPSATRIYPAHSKGLGPNGA